MTTTANLMKLWSWPWEAAKAATHLMETAAATQSVLAERLPLLSEAVLSPLTADRRELSLMVSEKVDAFGRSQRSVTKTGEVLLKAGEDNARDLGRIAGGGLLGPADWMRMFERNVALGAALVALPMQALAPVHKGVTANARRLRR